METIYPEATSDQCVALLSNYDDLATIAGSQKWRGIKKLCCHSTVFSVLCVLFLLKMKQFGVITLSLALLDIAQAVRFLGRVNPATRELTWPGTGVSFTFTGSSATIGLESVTGKLPEKGFASLVLSLTTAFICRYQQRSSHCRWKVYCHPKCQRHEHLNTCRASEGQTHR